MNIRTTLAVGTLLLFPMLAVAGEAPLVADVEGQPLAANVQRLLQALDFLGAPPPPGLRERLQAAIEARDAAALQRALDPQVLVVVSLNPEVRVKAARGPAPGVLQQGGFTPVLIKVVNESTVARPLNISSPQAGPPYAGAALAILKRQDQTELKSDESASGAAGRFLQVSMFRKPPMTPALSGLKVEYVLALLYSSEAGQREATLAFDVGGGTQDIGFRGETPVLFDVRPAAAVRLSVLDEDGRPTIARFTFRDELGRVYPPQARRLAPDFFFQSQIYRADGEVVLLPAGHYQMTYCRGPEYRVQQREVQVPERGPAEIAVRLQRWVRPTDYGFYCGDHHIHGAGCSHYSSPTLGVTPEDMFRQVKGEGLNVGCVLTWGPCFEFQRQYFQPSAAAVSEPLTLLKYDLEISGFGSAALGHVCLLNLNDQTYPGSAGTKTKGWPTWTVPVMRWCKEQGGVTGYPHSALHVQPEAAAKWLLERFDDDDDQALAGKEAQAALLPLPQADVDSDGDGRLSERELTDAADRASDQLPNFALPALSGAGAMEIFVSTPEGVCDFISAMDTARVSEWNTWYHLMNCGFPLKLSGETDFPCMSGQRVGQGRVYVQLGRGLERLDFGRWCDALAQGRSYVSDGFAHALQFAVNGCRPGFEDVQLDGPAEVEVTAAVAFAPQQPVGVAYGTLDAPAGRRMAGDTINLHAPRSKELRTGSSRLVELVMNGRVVARQEAPADGEKHQLTFRVPVGQSSWLALRQFPQLHTNPVRVIVAGRPIRASRRSALWCAESVRLLWHNRHRWIAEQERPAARAAYDRAIAAYEEIARESR